MTEIIFLVGHRQQHGKNTVVSILEEYLSERNVSYISTYFAKKLKKMCADKYGLDFSRMEDNTYKLSYPAWISQKVDVDKDGTIKYTPRSVRDILIEEGVSSRKIWADVWAEGVFKEIHHANKNIGIVSDCRYPNECDYIYTTPGRQLAPKKLVKVLVHRASGIFNDDGADNLLPDNDGNFWDHVIINQETGNWETDLINQVKDMGKKYGI